MAAEVKARITVDATNALRRIEEINKASGYTSASMSKMAKEIGETNAALSSLGAGMGGTASGAAFNNITEQLEKQALAYKLVDTESKAAANSASLYRNAIIQLTKSGSLTKEQTDELVRSYNSYRTAAEAATTANNTFNVSLGNSVLKLLSVAANILKFQLLMAPITAAIRGFRNALRDSVRMAAEAEQIYLKLTAVYDGLGNAAQSAADKLASSLGVANSTSANALATVGDLLQAQGMGTAESLEKASDWIQIFQDIIAFKNLHMTLDEFAQTFMSGAAGNLRNFRTFGSIVKESAVNVELARQGLDKLTGSELELAKMVTRAELALKQQENALGENEREWDTTISINRRWNEELKTTKEILGEDLNSWLNSFKKKTTEILKQWNDLNKLLKEMANGSIATESFAMTEENKLLIENAVDINLDDDKVKSILEVIILGVGAGLTGALTVATEGLAAPLAAAAFTAAGAAYAEYQKASQGNVVPVEYLLQLAATTGATMDQIEQIIHTQSDVYAKGGKLAEQLQANIDEAKKLYQDQKLIEKDRKNRLTLLESTNTSYDNLRDAINLIPGAKTSYGDILGYSKVAGDQALTDIAMQNYEYFSQKVIEEGFDSLMSAGLEEFGSSIEYFLDNLTDVSLLEAKGESLKKLFEVYWNYFWKDGVLSDEENAFLLKMKQGFEGINSEIESINRELERQKSLQSGLGGLEGSQKSYETQLRQLRMTDDERVLDDLKTSFEETLALAEGRDERRRVFAAYVNAYNALMALQKEQKKIEDEEKEKERVSKYEESLKSIQDSTQDYINQKNQIGMTENEKALDNLRIAYEKQIASLDLTEAELETLDAEYEKQREALIEFQKATDEAAKAAAELAAWKATANRAIGATGTLGNVVQAFQGEGDIWSKIINAVLAILENTKNWGRIAEILDRLFAMFEPVTDALINLIVSLPWDEIIFMLKVVASAVVIISGIVQEVIVIAKWLGKNIASGFYNIKVALHNLFNRRDKWEYAQLESFDSLQKTLESVAEDMVANTERIWNTEVDISNNLKKDDYAKQLALLKGLYDAGVLNADQYAGQVAKVTGSSLGSIEKYNGSTYATGARGTTYFSGNIVINGYNRDPEELAIEIERILERRAMAGANSF